MTLFGKALGALALAAASLPALLLPDAAAAKVELKLSTYLPPQHQMSKALEAWAEDLRTRSKGELDITVFPAGQMGPPPRQLDMVRTGVADIAFIYTAMTPGRFPRTDLLSLPFQMLDDEGAQISIADASWMATRMRDDFAADAPGVHFLYYVISTAGGFFMRDKAVEAPDDLKGLRVRPTSGAVSEMLAAMGASPATVSPTELADAIGKGVVDGAVFNFEGGKVFGLAQSVKQVTQLSFASGNFGLAINQDVYDRLPAELKALIDETTGPEAGRRIGALYDAAETAGEEDMVARGVQVRRLTGEQLAPFRTALAPVGEAMLADAKAKGADADAIVARIRDLKGEF